MNTQRLYLLCVVLTSAIASPAAAANFSGTHADITDFINGTEVSTRGVFIDAVNLSNNCCDAISTGDVTINGVTFKGVAPGQFHEAGEEFVNASFVYHGGEGYRDDNLWTSGGVYDTWRTRSYLMSTAATLTMAMDMAWSIFRPVVFMSCRSSC